MEHIRDRLSQSELRGMGTVTVDASEPDRDERQAEFREADAVRESRIPVYRVLAAVGLQLTWKPEYEDADYIESLTDQLESEDLEWTPDTECDEP